jgi:putative ABC transport system permease protein
VDLWIGQTVRADLYVTPLAQQTSGAAAALPPAVLEAITGVPGVRAIDRLRLIDDMTIGGRRVHARAVCFDVLAEESTFLFRKGEAAAILTAAIDEEAVIVSEPLARHQRLAEGDTLRLPTPSGPRDFRIAGVFYDYSSDSGVILFDLGLYARLWRDRAVNSLALYLEEPSAAGALRRRIAGIDGGRHSLLIRSHRDIRDAALAQFDQTFAVTMALKLITLVVAMAGVFFTLTVSVAERRAELGLLRAVGATVAQIRRMVLGEAVLIGLAALVVGTLTGIALALLLVFVINPQFFGWTIHWLLSPRVLVEAVAVVGAASLLAAWLPARSAMRADPAVSLREE